MYSDSTSHHPHCWCPGSRIIFHVIYSSSLLICVPTSTPRTPSPYSQCSSQNDPVKKHFRKSKTLQCLLISLIKSLWGPVKPHKFQPLVTSLTSSPPQLSSSSYCSSHTAFLVVQMCQDCSLTCTCSCLCPEHSSLRYPPSTS